MQSCSLPRKHELADGSETDTVDHLGVLKKEDNSH